MKDNSIEYKIKTSSTSVRPFIYERPSVSSVCIRILILLLLHVAYYHFEDVLELGKKHKFIKSEQSLDEPCLMLYTSGTTGLPKDVIYEHSNVICLVDWMKRFYKYDNNSKRAVYASYGFDANVFDTYGILVSGGSLHIIPEEMRLDLLAIQKYFNEN